MHPNLPEGFRSGFVALVGRPNVGKSTLLNRLAGEHLAIATHRAQTTRKRVRGIVNHENSQIILVDTPGLHLNKGSRGTGTRKKQAALNHYMITEAHSALGEVDVAVLLVEAEGRGHNPEAEAEDRMVIESLQRVTCPRLLVINKIDLLKKKHYLLPIIDAYHAKQMFAEILPLSAKEGEGTHRLLEVIESYLPKGPRYFPLEMVTDEPERLLVAEYIREQVLLRADQEIPYCTAVEVTSFEEVPQRQLVRIHAELFVERKSQKGILIGHGGQHLKTIGTEARKSIENLLGCKVYLELRVKHKKAWSKTKAGLRSVGYRDS